MSLLRPLLTDDQLVDVEGPSPPLLERRLPALLLTALGVIILTSYLAGGALGIGAPDDNEGFALRDDAWVQTSRSALDTPFAIPWLPSSLASRGSIAIALGRRSALRDFAAVTAAAATALFAAMLLQVGVPLFPAVLAALGLAFGATFWTRGISWSPDALAPALALAAAMLGRRWLARADMRMGAAAATAALVAIVENPSWVASLPAVAVLVWRRRPPGLRLGPSAILSALALIGMAALIARLELIRDSPWAEVVHAEVSNLWSMWALLSRSGSMPITALAIREFTSVGSLLLVIGLAVLWRTTRDRAAVAALVAGVVLVRYLTPQLQPEHAGASLAVVGWALAANGLAWLGTAAPRAGPVVAGIAGALLVAQPALARVRMAAIHEATAPSEARMASELRVNDLPDNSLVIANSRAADSSVRLSAALTGHSIVIVPQRTDLVESSLATGRPVITFPTAQAHLTSTGFLFERFLAGNTELGLVVGRQPCTELTPNQWIDVSLQLDSGAFSVRSETAATTPGRVSLYLAAPRAVMIRDRERLSTPYESTLLGEDEGAVPRQRLEDATARGGGMKGWPITVLNITSSRAPTQATFSLSEVPQAAMVTSTIAPAVTLCAAAARTDFALATSPRVFSSARMISNEVFGAGWHSAEGGNDTFRWTSSAESSIRAHVNRTGPIRVTASAIPAAPDRAGPRLGLAVNSCVLADLSQSPGLSDVTWVVEAECWKTGANQLWLRSGPLVSPASLGAGSDTRLLGARVSGVRLERMPQ